jgi:hypothetical protein
MALFAAHVWHFWIAAALVVPIVLAIIAVPILYVKKVVAPRYPRR